MLQELVQEIENTAKAVVNDIHTALPGEVVSFDASKSLAVVQPKGKFLTSDGTKLDYPKISEVPVCYPYANGIGVAFPVKVGDSCIIIVSEVELDTWRSGAESEAPLRFDLTSAMMIPGLICGGTDAIKKACNQNAVVITAGSSEIVVSRSGIAVSGDLTVNGSIEVTGSVSATGGVSGAGISLSGHTHTSAEPGKQTSKPK
jgi:hypothetical protein